MPKIEEELETTLPKPIRDFVFDLHDSVRRSCIMEEVQQLYEVKYKEITEQFFANTAWPEAKSIASEVRGDELFLALYREMTTRHITTKLKPQLIDHLNSWSNYKKLFELVGQTKDEDLCLTSQWIYDITQEFAYQFQGFCQFRSQSHLNQQTITTLQANKDAWNLPEMLMILHRLIRAANLKSTNFDTNSVTQQFGYFAAIELARIECLLGDYTASLQAVAHLRLNDRNELFMSLPICHFNVMYHIGVSNMMLKRFNEALDVFSEIILYVLRVLKPGAGSQLRQGVPAQLQRMVDKAMSLTAILMTIHPAYRMEDQVREAIETKFSEKIRRLQVGDRSSVVELFESSCPKFISPVVPDYAANAAAIAAASGGPVATVQTPQDVFNQQSSVFINEIMQYVPFLQLRSYLSMYASIDLSKLSRFAEMSELDLICLLLSYKNKIHAIAVASTNSNVASTVATSANSKSTRTGQDLQFRIDSNGVLVIDSIPGKYDAVLARERHFLSGVRKHDELQKQLRQAFAKL